MCGIAGIIIHNEGAESLKSPKILQYVRKMTAAIAHRGPDGEGHWVNENGYVGFGHKRLSIIDLSSAAAQPMHYLDQRYTLIFNGEVYNYVELKSLLSRQG